MHARRTHRPKGRWAPGRSGRSRRQSKGAGTGLSVRSRCTLLSARRIAKEALDHRPGLRGRGDDQGPLVRSSATRTPGAIEAKLSSTYVIFRWTGINRAVGACGIASGLLPNRISRSRSKSTGLWWSSPSPPSVRDIKKLLLHLGTSPVPQVFRPYRGSGLS